MITALEFATLLVYSQTVMGKLDLDFLEKALFLRGASRTVVFDVLTALRTRGPPTLRDLEDIKEKYGITDLEVLLNDRSQPEEMITLFFAQEGFGSAKQINDWINGNKMLMNIVLLLEV